MHIVFKVTIAIIVIIILNLLFNKINLLDSKIIGNYKKHEPFNDQEYISLIEDFKKKLNITSKVYLFYNPKAIQSNCKVKVYNNEIYIIIEKEINHKRLKGSLAHELGHVKMEHEIRQKPYSEFLCFLVNLLILTTLLYFLLNNKASIIIVLTAFLTLMSYILIVIPYISRKFQLEADTIAVSLLGSEYEKCLKELTGLNKHLSSIPIPWNDHPTLKKRLKNAKKN